MINNYSILNQRKYFSLNGLQNYLVIAPNIHHIEYISSNNGVEMWNSTGISQESITNPL